MTTSFSLRNPGIDRCTTPSRPFTAVRILALVVCLLLPPASSQAAPPEVTSLFPAGAARGQTVNVAAEGKFDRWPVQAWVNRPGIEVKASETKGTLSVNVAADAAAGICWIRLYDDEGAAALRPFMVGTLPEIEEKEPNDGLPESQPLESPGVIVNGRFSKNGDVDGFSLKLRQGETLVASLQANTELGSPMDGSLQVVSSAGFVLAHNDDCVGVDAQIVFTAPADGTYHIRGFAFPLVPTGSIQFAGADTFIYRLTLTTGPFIDHVLPLAITRPQPGPVELIGWNIPEPLRMLPVAEPGPDATEVILFRPEIANAATVRTVAHPSLVEAEPNDQVDQARDLPVPSTLTGQIGAQRDQDTYRVRATKGQALQVQVESRELGFDLDPLLAVLDETGKVLQELDDSGKSRDVSLTYAVPADGVYLLRVRDLHHTGGFRHNYRLTATLAAPDFSLAVTADRFSIPKDKPLEIPVTVNRVRGFAGEIEITVTGLPAGVSSPAVVSLAKGDTAKAVKLLLTAGTEPASGIIEIVGKSKSGDQDLQRIATAPLEPFNSQTRQLWLTTPAKAP